MPLPELPLNASVIDHKKQTKLLTETIDLLHGTIETIEQDIEELRTALSQILTSGIEEAPHPAQEDPEGYRPLRDSQTHYLTPTNKVARIETDSEGRYVIDVDKGDLKVYIEAGETHE